MSRDLSLQIHGTGEDHDEDASRHDTSGLAVAVSCTVTNVLLRDRLTDLIKAQWQILVRSDCVGYQGGDFLLVSWRQHHGDMLAISKME